MPRVKRSVNAKKKRREVLEQASGYWGLKSKTYRRAKEQVMRSGTTRSATARPASATSASSGSSASTRVPGSTGSRTRS